MRQLYIAATIYCINSVLRQLLRDTQINVGSCGNRFCRKSACHQFLFLGFDDGAVGSLGECFNKVLFANFGFLTEKLIEQAGRSRGRLKKVLQIRGRVAGTGGLEIQALPKLA